MARNHTCTGSLVPCSVVPVISDVAKALSRRVGPAETRRSDAAALTNAISENCNRPTALMEP